MDTTTTTKPGGDGGDGGSFPTLRAALEVDLASPGGEDQWNRWMLSELDWSRVVTRSEKHARERGLTRKEGLMRRIADLDGPARTLTASYKKNFPFLSEFVAPPGYP